MTGTVLESAAAPPWAAARHKGTSPSMRTDARAARRMIAFMLTSVRRASSEHAIKKQTSSSWAIEDVDCALSGVCVYRGIEFSGKHGGGTDRHRLAEGAAPFRERRIESGVGLRQRWPAGRWLAIHVGIASIPSNTYHGVWCANSNDGTWSVDGHRAEQPQPCRRGGYQFRGLGRVLPSRGGLGKDI